MENIVANDPLAAVNIVGEPNDLASILEIESDKFSWDIIPENLTHVSRIL